MKTLIPAFFFPLRKLKDSSMFYLTEDAKILCFFVELKQFKLESELAVKTFLLKHSVKTESTASLFYTKL